jgi:hypothetical protein
LSDRFESIFRLKVLLNTIQNSSNSTVVYLK